MQNTYPCQPASPQPGGTPRQRWIAAQRLGAGGPAVPPAVAADMLPEEQEPLAESDPWFRKLREACEALLALSPEAWAERAHQLAREAAERTLVDGKTAAASLVLRQVGRLAGPDVPEPEAEDDPDAEVEALLARLTPEERAEYESFRRMDAGELPDAEVDWSAPGFAFDYGSRLPPEDRGTVIPLRRPRAALPDG